MSNSLAFLSKYSFFFFNVNLQYMLNIAQIEQIIRIFTNRYIIEVNYINSNVFLSVSVKYHRCRKNNLVKKSRFKLEKCMNILQHNTYYIWSTILTIVFATHWQS